MITLTESLQIFCQVPDSSTTEEEYKGVREIYSGAGKDVTHVYFFGYAMCVKAAGSCLTKKEETCPKSSRSTLT